MSLAPIHQQEYTDVLALTKQCLMASLLYYIYMKNNSCSGQTQIWGGLNFLGSDIAKKCQF